MTLSKEDIKKLASMVKLHIPEEKLPEMQKNIEEILGYVDLLQGVDTEGVEGTAQVTGLTNVTFADDIEEKSRVFGADIEDACLNTSNQPKEMHQIKVPKVL